METIALIFAVITGLSLAAISIRNFIKHDLPLFGTLLSPKLHEGLDQTDKKLFTIAGISFVICFIFLIASF